MRNIKIIGAGITGLTIARQLTDKYHDLIIDIYDSRSKIGGNCSTTIEQTTGIETHDFGPHIFHTSDKNVWNFVNRFAEFNCYQHHVIAKHDDEMYFMPFNMHLFSQFFKLKNPTKNDIELCINKSKIKYDCPTNLEEQAISLIGSDIYNAFIKNYTKKQWNTDPKKLNPTIIRRIPVRFDYNINYYDDIYQGIPINGYQHMFDMMVDSPNIKVHLNEPAYSYIDYQNESSDTIIVYTGAVDAFFNYQLGVLDWRSLKFDRKIIDQIDYQGTPVVNYVDDDTIYTRSTEYKYFHPEKQCTVQKTVVDFETSQDWTPDRERFYPINDEKNLLLFNRYVKYGDSHKNLIFAGRLGKYSYFDMDDAINAAFTDVEIIEKVLIK